MESGLKVNDLVKELCRSPHGDLKQYVPTGKRAALEMTDTYAHLIAWNQRKGEIRDAKVALPVIALSTNDGPIWGEKSLPREYRDNALAHLALLDPRNLIRAIEFAKEIGIPHQRKRLRLMVERYLRNKEANFAKWERVAIQHRESLARLYRMYRVKPASFADDILFKSKYPAGSTFEVISQLKNMSGLEAAGQIAALKIPFLIASGAMGAKMKDPDVVMALIKRMSPTELVTNTKRFEKLGIKTVPALRAAFAEAITKASTGKRNMLKTSVAAEAIEDEEIKEKLVALQERQIQSHAGIDGNWLVLADKSGSMAQAIGIARQVAGTLAKFVKGTVTLVFFDTAAYGYDVTGLTMDQIELKTKGVSAGGGTAIGAGMQAAIDRKIDVDGIAIISDGGDNAPPLFPATYQKYVKAFDKEPTCFFYRVAGDPNALSGTCVKAGIDIQEFDLTGGVDYYSIGNIVQTMKVGRYQLLDEIMATPLLTLGDVLTRTAENCLVL